MFEQTGVRRCQAAGAVHDLDGADGHAGWPWRPATNPAPAGGAKHGAMQPPPTGAAHNRQPVARHACRASVRPAPYRLHAGIPHPPPPATTPAGTILANSIFAPTSHMDAPRLSPDGSALRITGRIRAVWRAGRTTWRDHGLLPTNAAPIIHFCHLVGLFHD